jgi:hypothetical protein
MKKFAVLLTFSTLLAACSNNQTPQQFQTSAPLNSLAVYQVAQRNGIGTTPNFSNPSFSTFGATATQAPTRFSSQAASPISLSVVVTSGTTIQATVATPYPSATLCTLEWGDGTTSTVATPATAGTYSHTYSSSAPQSVTFKCIARKLVLATQTVNFSFGSVLDFETPAITLPNIFAVFQTYSSQGYTISSKLYTSNSQALFSTRPEFFSNFWANTNHSAPPSQVMLWDYFGDTMIIGRTDNQPFAMKQFEFASWSGDASSFTVTGYIQGGGTVTMVITASNSRNPLSTKIFDSTWVNLSRVEIFGNSTVYIPAFDSNIVDLMMIDNLKVVP